MDWGEGEKLSSQNGSCPSSEADGPGGGEKGREGGGGLVSRSRRLLLRSPSLALTDGPAAPWGGLRTLVGGWGPFRPRCGGTLRGVCGHALGEEVAGSVRKSLSSEGGGSGGGGFTLIRPSQYLFFSAEPATGMKFGEEVGFI